VDDWSDVSPEGAAAAVANAESRVSGQDVAYAKIQAARQALANGDYANAVKLADDAVAAAEQPTTPATAAPAASGNSPAQQPAQTAPAITQTQKTRTRLFDGVLVT
jgi:hypothetical protein